MDKTADKNVIMISIHPQFAEAIFSGVKKIEFRKLNIPKNIKYIVLYVTTPEKKITGYFSVKEVVEASAKELWKRFRDVSGTSEEFFFKYYGEEGMGRGFLIDEVNVLEKPIPLKDFNGGGERPPQSFTYVDLKTWEKLKCRKKLFDFSITRLEPR